MRGIGIFLRYVAPFPLVRDGGLCGGMRFEFVVVFQFGLVLDWFLVCLDVLVFEFLDNLLCSTVVYAHLVSGGTYY